MQSMFVAKTTVLSTFDSLRVQALVFGSIVIAPFAFSTGQYYSLSWHFQSTQLLQSDFLLLDFSDDAGANRATALTNRKPQLLLHRDRRD